MADDQLPLEFDVIILGTGLTESITAAALSRIGKKVLHLDRNQYYGGQWATFCFDEFLHWISTHDEVKSGNEDNGQLKCIEDIVQDSKLDLVPIPHTESNVKNITIRSLIKDKEAVEENVNEEEKQCCNVMTDNGSSLEQDADETEVNVDRTKVSSYEVKETESNGDSDEKNMESSLSHAVETAEPSEMKSSQDITRREECMTEPGLDNVAGNEKQDIEDGAQSSAGNNFDVNVVFDQPSSPASMRLAAQAKLASHSPDVTLDDLKTLSRKFNIDLISKLMFARGPLIESLINANICHYAEFRTAERILTYKDRNIIQVPCSRADVFSSDMVSVIEKRVLMKFLSFCLTFDEHPEEYSEFSERPFLEFLQHKRLSLNLQHFIIYSIALTKPTVKTDDGLRDAQRFLRSLGRYSNSPFVLTLYGIGELPQAFCRMSAVFGGTYCLRRSAKCILVDRKSHLFKGLVCTNNQKITATHLIMEQSYMPEMWNNEAAEYVSRAILITNKSLKHYQDEPVTLLTMPPIRERDHAVHVIEIGPTSMACPIGLFLVHLTTTAVETAEKDLQPYINLLFDQIHDKEEDKPSLLWSVYFNQQCGDCKTKSHLPENAFVTSYPDETLGFDKAVQEAKQIFESICPNCDFLPAVPNPEDIIWDDTYRQLGPGGGFAQEEQELQEHPDDGNEVDELQQTDDSGMAQENSDVSQETHQQDADSTTVASLRNENLEEAEHKESSVSKQENSEKDNNT